MGRRSSLLIVTVLGWLCTASDCNQTRSYTAFEVNTVVARPEGLGLRVQKYSVEDRGWGGRQGQPGETRDVLLVDARVQPAASPLAPVDAPGPQLDALPAGCDLVAHVLAPSMREAADLFRCADRSAVLRWTDTTTRTRTREIRVPFASFAPSAPESVELSGTFAVSVDGRALVSTSRPSDRTWLVQADGSVSALPADFARKRSGEVSASIVLLPRGFAWLADETAGSSNAPLVFADAAGAVRKTVVVGAREGASADLQLVDGKLCLGGAPPIVCGLYEHGGRLVLLVRAARVEDDRVAEGATVARHVVVEYDEAGNETARTPVVF